MKIHRHYSHTYFSLCVGGGGRSRININAGLLHLVSAVDAISENKVLMNVGGLCDEVGSAGRLGSLIRWAGLRAPYLAPDCPPMGVIKTQLSFENCGTRCVERSTFGVVPRRLFFQIVTLRVIVADRRGVALPRSPGIASARCPVESTSGTGLRRGKYI